MTDGEGGQAAGTLIPVGDLPCTGGDPGAVVAGGGAGSSRWDGPKMENEKLGRECEQVPKEQGKSPKRSRLAETG